MKISKTTLSLTAMAGSLARPRVLRLGGLCNVSVGVRRWLGIPAGVVATIYKGGRLGLGGGTEHLCRWSGIPVGVVATTYKGGRLDLGGGTEHLCRWSGIPVGVVATTYKGGTEHL
jgi:hypothetical protein